MDFEKSAFKKLGHGNYVSWSTSVKAMLIIKGLWKRVNPAAVVREGDPDEDDEKALAHIMLSVEEFYLPTIAKCNTGKEAWKELHTLFVKQSKAIRMRLLDEMRALRKDLNETVTEYVARGQQLLGQLKEVEDTTTEEQLALQLLRGLPGEYDMLVTVLENVEGELTCADLLSRALVVEGKVSAQKFTRDQEVAALAALKPKVQQVTCWKCGQVGHKKNVCPSNRVYGFKNVIAL